SEELVGDESADPVAATVSGYTILRLGALETLDGWTDDLRARFTWLPDAAVIHGEYMARRGDHSDAMRAFGALAERGLPLFSDAYGYTLARLEAYLELGESEFERSLLAQAGSVLSSLRAVAGSADFTRSILEFTERSITAGTLAVEEEAGRSASSA